MLTHTLGCANMGSRIGGRRGPMRFRGIPDAPFRVGCGAKLKNGIRVGSKVTSRS